MKIKIGLSLVLTALFTSVAFAGHYFETDCLPGRRAMRELQEKKDDVISIYGGITIYHQSCHSCRGGGVFDDYRGAYCKMTYDKGR